MTIRIHPIKAFNDNYIWTLINDNNKQAIVIDPGQAQPVVDYLESNELELTSIWTTHHHHDHIGGVAELQESYPMTHLGCVRPYRQSYGLHLGYRWSEALLLRRYVVQCRLRSRLHWYD